MERNQRTADDAGQLDRRTVLKLTGAAAGSTVAVSGVVSAKRRNRNGGGKSGGRGQTSSTVILDEPFTVSNPRHITTNASCNSDQSAQQDYTRYDFEYCDDDLNEGGQTICVIPHQSEVNQDRVYEFRSKQDCKAPSSEFQVRFSFGPSNSECEADR